MNSIISFFKFILSIFRNDKPYTPTVPEITTDLDDLFQLHNKARLQRGLSELVFDIRLSNAAAKHATWMNNQRKMSHTGVGGSNHAERIKWEGYKASFSGENVAWGYKDCQSVFNGWLNSSGHRANILSSKYMHVGLGISGVYWCVVFATPGSFAVAEVAPFDAVYEPEPLSCPN
jgi:uncharacterized protein YkwD